MLRAVPAGAGGSGVAPGTERTPPRRCCRRRVLRAPRWPQPAPAPRGTPVWSGRAGDGPATPGVTPAPPDGGAEAALEPKVRGACDARKPRRARSGFTENAPGIVCPLSQPVPGLRAMAGRACAASQRVDRVPQDYSSQSASRRGALDAHPRHLDNGFFHLLTHRGLVGTATPSVLRGRRAWAVPPAAILAPGSAAAAATKQTGERHRWGGGEEGPCRRGAFRCARHGRAGGSRSPAAPPCLPALPLALALGERGSSPSPDGGTRRPFPGPRAAPRPPACRQPALPFRPARGSSGRRPLPRSFPPAGGGPGGGRPRARREPSAADSRRSSALRAVEAPARAGGESPGGDCLRAPLSRSSLPPAPRWKVRRRRGFCSRCLRSPFPAMPFPGRGARRGRGLAQAGSPCLPPAPLFFFIILVATRRCAFLRRHPRNLTEMRLGEGVCPCLGVFSLFLWGGWW